MKDQNKPEWLYGVKAIAGFLGVTERTVYRLLAGGGDAFPVHRVGGRWFAHPDDLRRWTAGARGAA